jgi:hypothetical protein
MSLVADAVSKLWEPQPGPQTSAILAAWCDELFFGGARGGGKSDFLLGDYLQGVAVGYGDLWRGIIFRKTYLELEELQIRATQLFPAYGGIYKVQSSVEFPFSNCWYFPSGETLKMRYLKSDKDAENYQGHQYAWIGFDELTNHATPTAYDKLKACLRIQGVPKRIRSSGNPGGKGHLWVKQRFIDCSPPYVPYLDKDTGLTRIYIPSRLGDNKYLRDDKQYVALIRASGSEELVKAWLDGNWDIVAGAYFDCWDKDKHVIKPFRIPAEWTRFRSFDWGSAKPFSVGWWAISDGSVLPKGALIRYREWYGRKETDYNVGLKLTAEAIAEGIKKREKGETIAYGVADPACWKEDGGPSHAERMAKAGVRFRPADNSRINGWDQMRQRFIGIDGAPMIYYFDTCLDSVRTIPLLQHDENNPEDLDSEMEDHCFAAGTMVNTRSGKVPIERLDESGIVESENGFAFYRSARLVKKQAKVIRLTFDDGTTVVCTPDHKFLEDTDDWRYAYDLLGRSVKCASMSSVQRFKSLMVSGTTYAVATFRRRVSDCIESFGSFILESSQMETTFTTQMETEQTIKSRICNVSVTSTTSQESMELSQESGARKASTRPGCLHQSGMDRKRAASGTHNTTISTSGLSWKRQSMLYVSTAARLIKSTLLRSIKASFAETTARRALCVSVEVMREKQDVYCLTVPSNSRFSIESGLIVSNCADDSRYACMSRPFSREVKQRKKPAEVGTIGWVYQRTKEEKTPSKYRS